MLVAVTTNVDVLVIKLAPRKELVALLEFPVEVKILFVFGHSIIAVMDWNVRKLFGGILYQNAKK
jgi:hypothetical protein